MKKLVCVVATLALMLGVVGTTFAEGVNYNRSNVYEASANVGFSKVVDENFAGSYDAEDNTLGASLAYWLTPSVSVGVDVSRVQLASRTWVTNLSATKHFRSDSALLPYVSLGAGVQGDGLVTTGTKGNATLGFGLKFIPSKLGVNVGVALSTAFDSDVADNREFTTNATAKVGLILLAF
jgi:hypothetical protein